MYAATDAWVCIEIYNKLMSVEPLQPIPTYLSEQEREQAQRQRKEQKERTKPRRRHRGRKRENREKQE